jgi:hypothetical protein
MLVRLLLTTAVALAAVAALAHSTLAWGEPKNEWPFTRSAAVRTPQTSVHRAVQVDPLIRGEPKNEPPFTRPAIVVVPSRGGFDLSSGGIGAAAGLGIAIAGAGVLRLARKSPRTA